MPYGTKILPYGKTLAILPNKKGGKCVNTHRPVGHPPEILISS